LRFALNESFCLAFCIKDQNGKAAKLIDSKQIQNGIIFAKIEKCPVDQN